MTSDNQPTLSIEGFQLIDSAGRQIQEALMLAQATPEYKAYLSAKAHFAALNKFFGVPVDLTDFKGELQMVRAGIDPNSPLSRDNRTPDKVVREPLEPKTPEQLRKEAGMAFPEDEEPKPEEPSE